MFDDCIIMAGGSGTRLWPASNSRRPKQFLDLSPGRSFFTAALERGLSVINRDGRVIIIAGKAHAPHILGACGRFSPEDRDRFLLIVEPMARNTAPALACGARYAALSTGKDRAILVLTSDHLISPLERFRADAAAAADCARTRRLVVFGIPPQGPETGYGYIEAGEALVTAGKPGGVAGVVTPAGGGGGTPPAEGAPLTENELKVWSQGGGSPPQVYQVLSFREKPDRKTAESFIATGRFYWNSGMFGFDSSFILEEFQQNAPEVLAPFEKTREVPAPFRDERGAWILKDWPGLAEAYAEAPSISFDYAIAEKCRRRAVVRAGFDWTDVGSWDEYARLLGDTGAETYRSGAEGCFVDADLPVALCGVDDLVVVIRSTGDGPRAALIARKGETQRVRDIVGRIKEAGRGELL